MKIFELVAELVLDTNGFTSEVDKATSDAKTLSSTLTSSVAKGVVAGQAVYDFTKTAVSSVMNFGQSLVETTAEVQAREAAFQSTFGELADEAEESFDRVGDANNIVSSRLKTVGTKAFAQFKGSGLDAAEALEMTEEYMQLAADAAAYYDMSLSDVDERLRSFMRGNTEAGDAIGLFTSALQRDQYALEMYDAKWQDLNESQRQTLLMSVVRDIYDQTNVLGQAAKESESYQNALDNLSAQWETIKAQLGAPVLDALRPALTELSNFLTNNGDSVQDFAGALGSIANLTFSAFTGMLSWLESILPDASGLMDSLAAFFEDEDTERLFNSIGDVFKELAGLTFTALEGVLNLMNMVAPVVEPFFASIAFSLRAISGVVGGLATAAEVPEDPDERAAYEIAEYKAWEDWYNETFPETPAPSSESDYAKAWDPATGEPFYQYMMKYPGDMVEYLQDTVDQALQSSRMDDSFDAGIAGAAIDYQQMGNAIAAAIAPELAAVIAPGVAAALNGTTVQMNGRAVGELVSQQINTQVKGLLRTTVTSLFNS